LKVRARYRLTFFLSLVLMAVSFSVGFAPSSARAATTVPAETIAIGVGRYGDSRVLQVGGDGVSNQSPVIVQPYRQGAPASVNGQRWILERKPTASGVPKFAYTVKHAATSKCLEKHGSTTGNGAAVLLHQCNGNINQVWWVDESPGPLGAHFHNLQDNRCLVVPAANTANGVALKTWDCAYDEEAWHHYFGVKTGKSFCGFGSDDGVPIGKYAAHCMEPAASFNGLMTSWHNHPVNISPRSSGTVPNQVRSTMEVTTLNAQGDPHGRLYFGSKAMLDGPPTARPTYAAFWGEATAAGFDYWTLPRVDSSGNPNGSDVGDGVQHTYMILGGTAGQWDVFYDYNFEKTTRFQASTKAESARVSLEADYLDAVTFTAPYDFRSRIQGPDGVWRRVRQAESATGTPKRCGGFPDSWDDTTGGGGNLPPWCLTGHRSFVGTGDTLDTDVFRVDKPATTASAAGATSTPGTSAARAAEGHVNGVDQNALKRCLDTAPDACLDTVEGLRECVTARKLCNTLTSPATTVAKPRLARLTVAQAKQRAIRFLAQPGSTQSSATALRVDSAEKHNARQARQRLTPGAVPRGIDDRDQVFVLAGTGAVKALGADGPNTYRSWSAVIDANTGDLLSAHLRNAS
jgi:hypothetical protein